MSCQHLRPIYTTSVALIQQYFWSHIGNRARNFAILKLFCCSHVETRKGTISEFSETNFSCVEVD